MSLIDDIKWKYEYTPLLNKIAILSQLVLQDLLLLLHTYYILNLTRVLDHEIHGYIWSHGILYGRTCQTNIEGHGHILSLMSLILPPIICNI